MTALARMLVTRDTAAGFASDDPVLRVGEMGIETDTNKMKVGDGVTAWSGLEYVTGALADDALHAIIGDDGAFVGDDTYSVIHGVAV